MDQILFVNSASFVDVSISSSLYVAQGTNVDFSQATQVSGSFVGNLIGTASFTLSTISASHADTASFVISASHANTASYVNNGQRIKSGIVSGSQFLGNPQIYTVVFNTPFPSLYSITVTGQSARTWVTQNETTSSFVINSNTKTTVTGFVYWQAIAIGEFNS